MFNFKSRDNFSYFNLSRNCPNSNDLLKMINKGKDNSLITFVVTTDEMLLLKLDFRRFTSLIISSELVSMIPMLFKELPLI